ncbi:MAG: Ppx/GppA family phosphatase [Bacteroidetes bacterium]|nr:Ppx/GppA family phosphatase [Bacteroidota bacterium]MBU1113922.1 Ppx/GppA family phosphatase [Bacteroidota bacterium]MBU1798241.1 Ppx/GppA family phosphatase [Bacteroidota bacterium]
MMNKKLAALDIGTNSFHLIVVSVLPSGNFEIIDREKEVIRLSEGNIGDIKTVQPQSIERAVEAINRFKKIADSHDAIMRATATSAVREALNKNEFIAAVLKRTGVEIEVISGLEEARLIYLGILKAVPIYNTKSLSIDIGGGSTEFIVGESGKILYSNSLKLGAVRLTQRFFPDYVLSNERIAKARKWVEGVLAPILTPIKNQNVQIFVGSSGTIMNIGMMLQAAKGEGNKENPILNNFEFTADDLFEIEGKILRKKTAETRKTIPGVEEKRVDIIPAGVIIISTIFKLLKIEKMIISDYALREGIILDSMDKFDIGGDGTKLHNIRFESIKQLAESSKYDSKHCYFVSKLALKLFDQLSELHNLDENAREFLEAASILHDIGYHISHAQHHRHTYYIIRNSAILGFNNTEIEIIANVARYHRKSHPKKSHEGYNTLSENQQQIVKQLSAILRIVDALDRTHNSSVIDFTTSISQNKVTIKLQATENMEVELWSLERRKALFEELFQRKVCVKVQQIDKQIQ